MSVAEAEVPVVVTGDDVIITDEVSTSTWSEERKDYVADCHPQAWPTFHDSTLCCRVCYREVLT